MTETTEPIDLDALLDGAKRSARLVKVYLRGDLQADIDELEAKLRIEKSTPTDEESLGGNPAIKELENRIDALYLQMGASQLDLRVSFLDGDEQDAIAAKVKTDLKEDADKAASDARKQAREDCPRFEIKGVNDINEFVRNAAMEASTELLAKEATLRTLADAILSPAMSVEQVRKLTKVIGEGQTKMIMQAYNRATNDAPRIQVPKSLKPSPSHDGGTSF